MTAIRRTDVRVAVVVLLAVLAIVGGVLLGHRPSSATAAKPSAKDKIAADPPPALFADAQLAGTARSIDAQRTLAARRVRAWVAAHGTRPDDAAFVTWLEATFPKPPAGLAAQMPVVVALDKHRTPAGVKAATWLEGHGKKDIWKLYAHDQRELLPTQRGADVKKTEKAGLKLAKTIADTLGARFGSSAPYVRVPALRPDHKVTRGQKCPCSYPSRHAAASAASEVLLGHLAPLRDLEYRHMEAEVDYSRVYMAGHFPADIQAGALLGDMIGDYLLVTREGVDPRQL